MKIFLPFLLALSALPAQAEIYKWTDANGKIHYSDRPQDGVDAKVQPLSGVQATSSTAAAKDDWREREQASRKNWLRQTASERRASSQEEAAKTTQQPYNPSAHRSNNAMSDEELCTRDRQQIEFAEKTKHLSITHGGNSPRRLTEAQRQEVILERKTNHALTCGSGRRR
jgi:hypothetical protein